MLLILMTPCTMGCIEPRGEVSTGGESNRHLPGILVWLEQCSVLIEMGDNGFTLNVQVIAFHLGHPIPLSTPATPLSHFIAS